MSLDEWVEQFLLAALNDIPGVSTVDPVLGPMEVWQVTMEDGSSFLLTVQVVRPLHDRLPR